MRSVIECFKDIFVNLKSRGFRLDEVKPDEACDDITYFRVLTADNKLADIDEFQICLMDDDISKQLRSSGAILKRASFYPGSDEIDAYPWVLLPMNKDDVLNEKKKIVFFTTEPEQIEENDRKHRSFAYCLAKTTMFGKANFEAKQFMDQNSNSKSKGNFLANENMVDELIDSLEKTHVSDSLYIKELQAQVEKENLRNAQLQNELYKAHSIIKYGSSKLVSALEDHASECYNQKQFEEAVKIYDYAIEVEQSTRCDSFKLADLYLWKAQIHLSLKQYVEAINTATLACNQRSNCVFSLEVRAKASFELGQYSYACEDIEQILELDPDDVEAKEFLNRVKVKEILEKYVANK